MKDEDGPPLYFWKNPFFVISFYLIFLLVYVCNYNTYVHRGQLVHNSPDFF